MSHFYRVYGLSIKSELECPELIPMQPISNPDVCITLGDLSATLADTAFSDERVQITSGIYQFDIEGIGRFRAEQGKRIIIDALPNAKSDEIRVYLLGVAMGITPLLRGMLPLHASAIATKGVAHAFCGDSGAGKSTLVEALRRRGFNLMTDDVGALDPDTEQPLFHAGFPRIKLWGDVLNHFGMDSNSLATDFFRDQKFHMRLHEDFQVEPLPLKRLYLLDRSSNSEIAIEPIQGYEALEVIRKNTYGANRVIQLGLAARNLKNCGSIARRLQIFRFRRPWQLSRIDDALDALIDHFSTSENEASITTRG